MRILKRLTVASLLGLGLFGLGIAQARTADSCQTAWAKAVRSYLTQNRRAGPDGRTPTNPDEEELMTQAWEAAFSPACRLEQDGLKPEARIEAAMLGVQILAKLDLRGCGSFMQYYMGSSRGKDICDMASAGSGSAEIRKTIESSIPPAK